MLISFWLQLVLLGFRFARSPFGGIKTLGSIYLVLREGLSRHL